MFSVVILSNTYMLYTWLDKNMINSIIGSTEAGYYGVAQKVMSMIDILIFTIVQVSMARLSNYLENYSKKMYSELLNKVIKIYFFLLFPSSIGLLCISKQVIIIVGKGTDVYLSAIPILMIFSLYMLTIGIDRIIANQIIYIFGKEREDVKLVFIGGIINFVLNEILIFVNMFTPINVILTTLCANIIVILMEYSLVKRDIKLDVEIFTFSNFKYIMYSLIFIPLTFFMEHISSNILFVCGLDIIICSAVYALILAITKDKTFQSLIRIIIANRTR